jgi:hypothetical protein
MVLDTDLAGVLTLQATVEGCNDIIFQNLSFRFNPIVESSALLLAAFVVKLLGALPHSSLECANHQRLLLSSASLDVQPVAP